MMDAFKLLFRCLVGGLLLSLAFPISAADQVPELDLSQPRWSFGGWTSLLYQDQDQTAQRRFLNVNYVDIFASYRISDTWLALGEVAYEQPLNLLGEASEELLLERLYLEFNHRSWFNIRLGKFDTQAGIIKPIHWQVSLDTITNPIMEDNSYIPAKSVGLECFGHHFLGTHAFTYSFALSHSESELADNERIKQAKGAGINLDVERLGRYRFGTSHYFYRDPKDKDRTIQAMQPYGEFWALPGHLLIRAEWLYLDREQASLIRTWYAKVKWRFRKDWFVNLRYDRGQDQRNADGAKRVARSLTLAYRPHPNWRLRMEYTVNRFKELGREDFDHWATWAAWIF